ncbi:unnamed protein product, partial [Scytosiphon promiscuus]
MGGQPSSEEEAAEGRQPGSEDEAGKDEGSREQEAAAAAVGAPTAVDDGAQEDQGIDPAGSDAAAEEKKQVVEAVPIASAGAAVAVTARVTETDDSCAPMAGDTRDATETAEDGGDGGRPEEVSTPAPEEGVDSADACAQEGERGDAAAAAATATATAAATSVTSENGSEKDKEAKEEAKEESSTGTESEA